MFGAPGNGSHVPMWYLLGSDRDDDDYIMTFGSMKVLSWCLGPVQQQTDLLGVGLLGTKFFLPVCAPAYEPDRCWFQ